MLKKHQRYHFLKFFFSTIQVGASCCQAGSDLHTTCKRYKTFGKVSP